ncbi:MAG: type II toxin-antitoxin system RelE/ParE family toxin [Chloroflexota bacterium]|nr:MAG: plasmid maintenance system killer protein [Bellilinea sp.]
MIKSFKDKITSNLFQVTELDNTLIHPICQKLGIQNDQLRIFKRKLNMLHAATTLKDLKSPPGNHLEKLTGERQGQWSIRVNDQYRICFRWQNGDAYDVEITDYH